MRKIHQKDGDNIQTLLPWQEVKGKVIQSKVDDENISLMLSYEKIIKIKIPHKLNAEKANLLKELKNSRVSILRTDKDFHIKIEDKPFASKGVPGKCSTRSIQSTVAGSNRCCNCYQSLGGCVNEKTW
jgi:hypothetical protein